MLERTWLLAYRSEWRKDALLRTALEVATTGSAEVLHLDRYGVSPGGKADLVIIPEAACVRFLHYRAGEKAERDLKFRVAKQARHTNLEPQNTPPLRSRRRLHVRQVRSGDWSYRLPGKGLGTLTGPVAALA
jgi:adenine deaminase